MLVAALDTSTDWCSAALWRDGAIAGVERHAPNRHSELVLPMLQRLAEHAGASFEQLEAVAFGAGPGSFTGLRIACGLAQGIALARGLPVLGVSTLEAMAEECGARRVVAALDARMGEVYWAAYERDGTGWRTVVAPQCAPPDAVSAPEGAGWVGCGPAFAAYPAFLRHRISAVMPDIHPSATAIARLAAPRLGAGEGMDAAFAAPVYLRDKVALTAEERR